MFLILTVSIATEKWLISLVRSLNRGYRFEFGMFVSIYRLETTIQTQTYTSLSTKSIIVQERGANCFQRQYKATAIPKVATKSRINIAIEPAVAELGLQQVSVRQQAALSEESQAQQDRPPLQNCSVHDDISKTINSRRLQQPKWNKQKNGWKSSKQCTDSHHPIQTKVPKSIHLSIKFKSKASTGRSKVFQNHQSLIFVITFLYLLSVSFLKRENTSANHFKINFDLYELQ